MPTGLYVGLSSGNVGIGTTGIAGTSNAVNVTTSGAAGAMTVLANGNVGIGTTTPLANLHVNGTLYYSGSIINNVIASYTAPNGGITTTSNTLQATVVLVTIQPKFSTSKILINFSSHMTYILGDNGGRIHIFRSINNGAFTQITTGYGVYFQPGSTPNAYIPVHFIYPDTPATTQTITYKIYISSDGGFTFGFHQTSLIVMVAQEICT